MNCGEIRTKVFQRVKEKIVFIGRRVPRAFAKSPVEQLREAGRLVAGGRGGVRASEALGLLDPQIRGEDQLDQVG
jgi:hypothetical protein